MIASKLVYVSIEDSERLIGRCGHKVTPTMAINCYESACAGNGIYASEFPTEEKCHISIEHGNTSNAISVKINGNSMTDAGIEDGDEVVVRKDLKLFNGCTVLAMIDGEMMIKTYCYFDDDKTHWLMPRNKTCRAVLLTKDIDVKLVGVVDKILKSPKQLIEQHRIELRDFQRNQFGIGLSNFGKTDIPEELDTPKARSIWKCLIAKGWVNETLQPTLSRTQAVVLADRIGEILQIENRWKSFEILWKREHISADFQKALSQKQYPKWRRKFEEEISL